MILIMRAYFIRVIGTKDGFFDKQIPFKYELYLCLNICHYEILKACEIFRKLK